MVLGVVGIVLYFAVGLFYLGSGLVMPYPWVFGMWVIWAGGFVILFRVFSESRAWTPAVPVAAMVFWVIIVQLGSWIFDWTA